MTDNHSSSSSSSSGEGPLLGTLDPTTYVGRHIKIIAGKGIHLKGIIVSYNSGWLNVNTAESTDDPDLLSIKKRPLEVQVLPPETTSSTQTSTSNKRINRHTNTPSSSAAKRITPTVSESGTPNDSDHHTDNETMNDTTNTTSSSRSVRRSSTTQPSTSAASSTATNTSHKSTNPTKAGTSSSTATTAASTTNTTKGGRRKSGPTWYYTSSSSDEENETVENSTNQANTTDTTNADNEEGSRDRQLIGEAIRILEGKHTGQIGFVIAKQDNNTFIVRVGNEELPKNRNEFRREASIAKVMAALQSSSNGLESPTNDSSTRTRTGFVSGGGASRRTRSTIGSTASSVTVQPDSTTTTTTTLTSTKSSSSSGTSSGKHTKTSTVNDKDNMVTDETTETTTRPSSSSSRRASTGTADGKEKSHSATTGTKSKNGTSIAATVQQIQDQPEEKAPKRRSGPGWFYVSETESEPSNDEGTSSKRTTKEKDEIIAPPELLAAPRRTRHGTVFDPNEPITETNVPDNTHEGSYPIASTSGSSSSSTTVSSSKGITKPASSASSSIPDDKPEPTVIPPTEISSPVEPVISVDNSSMNQRSNNNNRKVHRKSTTATATTTITSTTVSSSSTSSNETVGDGSVEPSTTLSTVVPAISSDTVMDTSSSSSSSSSSLTTETGIPLTTDHGKIPTETVLPITLSPSSPSSSKIGSRTKQALQELQKESLKANAGGSSSSGRKRNRPSTGGDSTSNSNTTSLHPRDDSMMLMMLTGNETNAYDGNSSSHSGIMMNTDYPVSTYGDRSNVHGTTETGDETMLTMNEQHDVQPHPQSPSETTTTALTSSAVRKRKAGRPSRSSRNDDSAPILPPYPSEGLPMDGTVSGGNDYYTHGPTVKFMNENTLDEDDQDDNELNDNEEDMDEEMGNRETTADRRRRRKGRKLALKERRRKDRETAHTTIESGEGKERQPGDNENDEEQTARGEGKEPTGETRQRRRGKDSSIPSIQERVAMYVRRHLEKFAIEKRTNVRPFFQQLDLPKFGDPWYLRARERAWWTDDPYCTSLLHALHSRATVPGDGKEPSVVGADTNPHTTGTEVSLSSTGKSGPPNASSSGASSLTQISDIAKAVEAIIWSTTKKAEAEKDAKERAVEKEALEREAAQLATLITASIASASTMPLPPTVTVSSATSTGTSVTVAPPKKRGRHPNQPQPSVSTPTATTNDPVTEKTVEKGITGDSSVSETKTSAEADIDTMVDTDTVLSSTVAVSVPATITTPTPNIPSVAESTVTVPSASSGTDPLTLRNLSGSSLPGSATSTALPTSTTEPRPRVRYYKVGAHRLQKLENLALGYPVSDSSSEEDEWNDWDPSAPTLDGRWPAGTRAPWNKLPYPEPPNDYIRAMKPYYEDIRVARNDPYWHAESYRYDNKCERFAARGSRRRPPHYGMWALSAFVEREEERFLYDRNEVAIGTYVKSDKNRSTVSSTVTSTATSRAASPLQGTHSASTTLRTTSPSPLVGSTNDTTFGTMNPIITPPQPTRTTNVRSTGNQGSTGPTGGNKDNIKFRLPANFNQSIAYRIVHTMRPPHDTATAYSYERCIHCGVPKEDGIDHCWNESCPLCPVHPSYLSFKKAKQEGEILLRQKLLTAPDGTVATIPTLLHESTDDNTNTLTSLSSSSSSLLPLHNASPSEEQHRKQAGYEKLSASLPFPVPSLVPYKDIHAASTVRLLDEHMVAPLQSSLVLQETVHHSGLVGKEKDNNKGGSSSTTTTASVPSASTKALETVFDIGGPYARGIVPVHYNLVFNSSARRIFAGNVAGIRNEKDGKKNPEGNDNVIPATAHWNVYKEMQQQGNDPSTITSISTSFTATTATGREPSPTHPSTVPPPLTRKNPLYDPDSDDETIDYPIHRSIPSVAPVWKPGSVRKLFSTIPKLTPSVPTTDAVGTGANHASESSVSANVHPPSKKSSKRGNKGRSSRHAGWVYVDETGKEIIMEAPQNDDTYDDDNADDPMGGDTTTNDDNKRRKLNTNGRKKGGKDGGGDTEDTPTLATTEDHDDTVNDNSGSATNTGTEGVGAESTAAVALTETVTSSSIETTVGTQEMNSTVSSAAVTATLGNPSSSSTTVTGNVSNKEKRKFGPRGKRDVVTMLEEHFGPRIYHQDADPSDPLQIELAKERADDPYYADYDPYVAPENCTDIPTNGRPIPLPYDPSVVESVYDISVTHGSTGRERNRSTTRDRSDSITGIHDNNLQRRLRAESYSSIIAGSSPVTSPQLRGMGSHPSSSSSSGSHTTTAAAFTQGISLALLPEMETLALPGTQHKTEGTTTGTSTSGSSSHGSTLGISVPMGANNTLVDDGTDDLLPDCPEAKAYADMLAFRLAATADAEILADYLFDAPVKYIGIESLYPRLQRHGDGRETQHPFYEALNLGFAPDAYLRTHAAFVHQSLINEAWSKARMDGSLGSLPLTASGTDIDVSALLRRPGYPTRGVTTVPDGNAPSFADGLAFRVSSWHRGDEQDHPDTERAALLMDMAVSQLPLEEHKALSKLTHARMNEINERFLKEQIHQLQQQQQVQQPPSTTISSSPTSITLSNNFSHKNDTSIVTISPSLPSVISPATVTRTPSLTNASPSMHHPDSNPNSNPHSHNTVQELLDASALSSHHPTTANMENGMEADNDNNDDELDQDYGNGDDDHGIGNGEEIITEDDNRNTDNVVHDGSNYNYPPQLHPPPHHHPRHPHHPSLVSTMDYSNDQNVGYTDEHTNLNDDEVDEDRDDYDENNDENMDDDQDDDGNNDNQGTSSNYPDNDDDEEEDNDDDDDTGNDNDDDGEDDNDDEDGEDDNDDDGDDDEEEEEDTVDV